MWKYRTSCLSFFHWMDVENCMSSLGLGSDCYHFMFRSRYLWVVKLLNRPIRTLSFFFYWVADVCGLSGRSNILWLMTWHFRSNGILTWYELFMVKSIGQISIKWSNRVLNNRQSTIIMNDFFLSLFLFI